MRISSNTIENSIKVKYIIINQIDKSISFAIKYWNQLKQDTKNKQKSGVCILNV